MFEAYKHAHFVGIGGIGMSALAKWFVHEGVTVTGSDMSASEITQSLVDRGIQVHIGHNAAQVPEQADVLIYSPAVPETNPERVRAQERNIKQMSNFEMLGKISAHYRTIVVTGTNGKSTTTAMLGTILTDAGLDPTVLVGSLVPGFEEGNLRVGQSTWFVVEGCEYRANMMHMQPEMVVLTNVQEDHLDYYRDLAHIQETFQTFIDKLPEGGVLIRNGLDEHSHAMQAPKIIQVEGEQADIRIINRETRQGMQRIVVQTDTDVEVNLQVPGTFNAHNALEAMAAAHQVGVSFETAAESLKNFTGIWRRFERVGTWKGAEVISDYGHHPTAVKETIEAAREFFPGSRIILCFQPHQHDRTRQLFDEFVEVLPGADVTIVVEVYDVVGRNEDQTVSSAELVEGMNQHGAATQFAPDFVTAREQLKSIVQPNDVVLIMGAGDIDSLARNLV